MWGYIIGIGIFIVLVFLYVYSYSLNEKTEKPEGCEDTECKGCKTENCSHRQD